MLTKFLSGLFPGGDPSWWAIAGWYLETLVWNITKSISANSDVLEFDTDAAMPVPCMVPLMEHGEVYPTGCARG